MSAKDVFMFTWGRTKVTKNLGVLIISFGRTVEDIYQQRGKATEYTINQDTH